VQKEVIMTDPKRELINEIKASVQKGEENFEVEKALNEEELDTVSGGECLCKCAADYGGNPTCGGGGGGGKAAFDEIAT
jgi:hypothetical protein